jgi:hypothetical protein
MRFKHRAPSAGPYWSSPDDGHNRGTCPYQKLHCPRWGTTIRRCVIRVNDTDLRTRTARDATLMHNGGTAWAHNGRATGEDGQARTARRERRSSRAPFVVVMQTAEVWNGDDRATRRLGGPMDGSILIQREESALPVIIGEVALEVPAQRPLVPHDDVIEALADRSDHAFDERILPRTTRRRQHVVDADGVQRTARIRSVDRVTIPDDEALGGLPRPRLAELLRGPLGGWMRGDVQVDDAASIVRQHDEHKQHAKRGGWGP